MKRTYTFIIKIKIPVFLKHNICNDIDYYLLMILITIH